MVLINFICRLHIPYDLYIDFTASRCINRPLDLHFGPNFVIFGPEMKVQRSFEAPGCSGINIKVIKDIQSTNTVDQMYLEFKI